MALVTLPRQLVVDINGEPRIAARLFVYDAESSNIRVAYTSKSYAIEHSQPILSVEGGIFPIIEVNPAGGDYKIVLQDRDGAEIYSADNLVPIESITQATVGLALYPRTPAETAAGVTPTNYSAPSYTSPRYGAVNDGNGEGIGTENSTPLLNMINAAEGSAGIGSGHVTLTNTSGGAFRLNAGLVINTDKTLLDGQGNVLDFTSITTAYSGLKLLGGDQGSQLSSALHAARGVRDLVIINPAYTTNANAVGLEIVDATDNGGGNWLNPCQTIDHVSIIGGQYGVKFGLGVFNVKFNGLTILNNAGHALHTAIYAPAPWTDGGESPCFVNSFFGNCVIGVHIAGGVGTLGSMRFIGGNIDGTQQVARHDGFGVISFLGVYFEFVDGSDTHYKFHAADANAKIELVGCEFNPRGDLAIRDTFAWAYVTGSLNLSDVAFQSDGTQWYTANSGFLVDGPGTVRAKGIRHHNVEWWPLVHKSLQWLAYPDINNANALGPFALSNVGGGADPVRATAVSDGSTSRDALHFFVGNGASSNDESAAEFTHACEPGRAVSIVGAFYCPSITSGNVALEIVGFVFEDGDGNTISGPFTTHELTITTVGSWSTFEGFTAHSPSGTESLTFTIRLRASGAVSGDKNCYISPLGIGYADGQ